MAAIARLTGRRIGLTLYNYERNVMLLMRPVSMKISKATPPSKESYDEVNMKLGRPYSPHLTIYAPQLTSLLSVTHRGTGLILSGVTMFFGLTALLLPHGALPTLIDFIHNHGALLFLAKLGLSVPFAFHFSNGIRHLLWDLGKFLTLKEVYMTGYGVLASTAVLGLIFAAM